MENKKKLIKIAIPLAIIAVIGLMWFVKNASDEEAMSQAGVNSSTEGEALNPDLELCATEEPDLETLLAYNVPVILNFSASWCGPCQSMKPHLESASAAVYGKAIIKYIDVDEFPEFTSNFPVSSVPTQFLYTADGAPFMPEEDTDFPYLDYYQLRESGEHVLTARSGYMDEETIIALLVEMGMKND